MSRPKSRLLHKVISLCKRRGFIFQIPDGGERAYDYGPLGTELKSNFINEWKHAVVTSTGNVHAVESSIFTPQRILEATSVEPSKQGLYCAVSSEMASESSGEDQQLSQPLFLRPNITQGAVIYFLDCAKSMGLKLPFGIAEVGKVFRNQSPKRHFIFTKQEFEQAALQFFCPPSEHRQWYFHWQKRRLQWWKRFACNPDRFSVQEVAQPDLSDHTPQHSSIQFRFPWGSHDVESVTNTADTHLKRLSQVQEDSSSSLKRAKMENEKTFPSMISLCAGIDRRSRGLVLHLPHAQLPAHREVLKLHTCLAPYKVAVLPTQEDNQKLCMFVLTIIHRSRGTGRPGSIHHTNDVRVLADELRHVGIQTTYSDVGSFEYRLAVQDEIGTPYRIIADEGTLETGLVALQHRDTTIEEPMNGQDVLHSVQRMLLGARLN